MRSNMSSSSMHNALRSVLIRFTFQSSRPCPCLRRNIHTSRPAQARHKPKHKSIKAADMNLTIARSVSKKRRMTIDRYTPEEKAGLSERYTPEQIAAIEAGEEAIDPQDLEEQGALKNDVLMPHYLDDFSMHHPVVDKPIRAPESNYDPNLRLKTQDEYVEEIADYIKSLPEDAEPDTVDWMRFMDKQRLTVGKPEAENNTPSSLAPTLPKIDALQPTIVREDTDPILQRLIRQTGYDAKQIDRFRIKQLVHHRVVNQTRMGKQQKEYYLTIAGNENGMLGIGEGKSREPEDAQRQAKFNAIRNLRPVPRYEDRTIFGDVKAKVGATVVELMTRPPGVCPVPTN